MEIAAACHIHSKWSYDGSWELEAIAGEMGRRGYRVVLMTEHDRGFSGARLAEFRGACRAASNAQVLVVPGIEYSEETNTIHVLTWGDVPFLGENRPTLEVLKSVSEQGGAAVFAHPTRRNAWRRFDPLWIPYLSGIEIWNRKTDGWKPSKTAPALLQSSGLPPYAGMDFHDRPQLFPLAMVLDLAGEPTETTVVEALRLRRVKPQAFGYDLTPGVVGAGSVALAPFEFVRRSLAWMNRNWRPQSRLKRSASGDGT